MRRYQCKIFSRMALLIDNPGIRWVFTVFLLIIINASFQGCEASIIIKLMENRAWCTSGDKYKRKPLRKYYNTNHILPRINGLIIRKSIYSQLDSRFMLSAFFAISAMYRSTSSLFSFRTASSLLVSMFSSIVRVKISSCSSF